jgi:diguanylate cyclase (GGDEF)-like protein
MATLVPSYLDPAAAVPSPYENVAFRAPRPGRRAETLPPDPLRARRVLIADDDRNRGLRLANELETEGLEVFVCDLSDDVVIQVVSAHPDVILLHDDEKSDRQLLLCRQLRDFESARMRAIVVYASGDTGEDAAVAALDAGADDYVHAVGLGRELRARVSVQLRYLRDREVMQWARSQRTWLKDLAHTDPLTGVANRRGATRALGRALAVGLPVTVALVDLDYFKRFNDTYGHAIGDAVLRRVARALANVIPGTGLAARWGGEEFAVIMPGHSTDDPVEIGERLRQAVGDVVLFEVEGAPQVTASVGVARWEGDGERPSIPVLVAAADTALYESKESGRNRVSSACLPRAG